MEAMIGRSSSLRVDSGQIKYDLLPSLILTPGVVAELDASVLQDEGFRTDPAHASCKEPLSSAVGDLATWLVGQ
eukprot:3970348-Lingulodinium_polyedra.AAC.1